MVRDCLKRNFAPVCVHKRRYLPLVAGCPFDSGVLDYAILTKNLDKFSVKPGSNGSLVADGNAFANAACKLN